MLSLIVAVTVLVLIALAVIVFAAYSAGYHAGASKRSAVDFHRGFRRGHILGKGARR